MTVAEIGQEKLALRLARRLRERGIRQNSIEWKHAALIKVESVMRRVCDVVAPVHDLRLKGWRLSPPDLGRRNAGNDKRIYRSRLRRADIGSPLSFFYS